VSGPIALNHVIDGPEDAPVIVFGPSIGATVEMWRPQVVGLADRFRLVRYDTRGHGGSPVPDGPYSLADIGGDVLALLDTLGLDRVHFCGLSLGGMTGIWLAANAPERINRLVVCCSSPHMPPAEGWRDRAATVRAAGSTEPIADATAGRWVTPEFATRDPETFAWMRAMIASAPAAGYAGCCEAIGAMDLRPDLPRIAAPTLIFGGEQDPAAPPSHQQLMADGIPGARLELVSPGQHLATWEQSDTANALIRDHLETSA